MARKRVTEDDLGLAPTPEEMAPVVTPDDDVPLDTDPIEEPTPPVTEPPPATPPAQPEEPKTVDVRALQEVRSELREAKRQSAILEQRWNDYLAYQKQPQEPAKAEPVVPDGSSDPMALVKWTAEQVQAMQKQGTEREAATQEQQRQAEAFRQAYTKVNSDFATAAQADPSLNDALKALRTSMAQEAAAYGYQPHQVQQYVTETENQHIAYMAQNGLDVAAYIKGQAGARGWQATAPQQVAPKTDIAALAASQQRHQSLSDASGGAPPAPLDAKQLLKMNDKEWKAFMRSRGADDKLDEILGA